MSRHHVLDPAVGVQIPTGRCALGIMTKVPRAGKVKTRLIPPLRAEEAAKLNFCFLRDISASIGSICRRAHRATKRPRLPLEELQRQPRDDVPARLGRKLELDGRGVAIYTPSGSEAAYSNILPRDFFLIAQRGEAFGERLENAAEDLFTVGFESVCLINSDSPTVPASTFAQAVTELAEAGDRVVLGPSVDGGYYLIGIKQLHRRLFAEIDWSTERVLEQTLQRASELGLPVHQLPSGFDVDDGVSLRRLCDDLLEEGGKSDIAPATRKFLSDIIAREGRNRIWPVS